MRAFLAVPADPAWQERIAEHLYALRPKLPPASWTKPETWHLTLKFLGEVSETMPTEAGAAFLAAASASERTALRFAGPETIPSRRHVRVLGLALETNIALADLALEMDRVASQFGVPRKNRTFRPHLTLARCRSPWSPAAIDNYWEALSGWTLPEWPVTEIIFYRSELRPGGAVHTAVARFPLGAR